MAEESRDRAAGLAGLHRYTWWTVPGTTALFLVFVGGAWVLDPDVPVLARGTCALALAVTVVAVVVLLSQRLAGPADDTSEFAMPHAERHDMSGVLPARLLITGCVGAAVLGGVQLAFGEYGLWSMAPAIMVVATATFLPPPRRRTLIAGAVAVAPVPGGIVSLVSGDDLLYAAAFPPGLLVAIAWVTLGPLWAWDVAGRLSRERWLSALLAVKDERLRFAADLHDIQGHHLQVIALKSELAARLARTDPAEAAEQMNEVQRLSTEALQDTKAVVQGYRRTALNDEIANATNVLAAAGIEAQMAVDRVTAAETDGLSEASRHLLGLVMREITTNVLRHSQARHADVDYHVDGDIAHLRMRNDGANKLSALDESPGAGLPDGMGSGSGLSTLAERLEAVGGRLNWEQDGDDFLVAASLPLAINGEAG